MKIFSMYDVKGEFYLQPFPEHSTVAALRGFSVAVNGTDSMFAKFPDDFALVELAEFDQKTGVITPLENPVNLGSARTVLKTPESQMPMFPGNRSNYGSLNDYTDVSKK